METKVDGKSMEGIRRKCCFPNGIEVGAEGSRGGICLAWKEEFQICLKTFSSSHMDVSIQGGSANDEWRFTSFYGSPYMQNKIALWDLLRSLSKEQNYPWLVCVDFNEIMYSFEKSGGQSRKEKRMEAFRGVLEECQLIDVGYTGVWFMWERGNIPETNIRERLDRGVVNEKWMQLFPRGNIHHLTSSLSDHCPLLINTTIENSFKGAKSFKFESWWIMENTIEHVVKEMWELSTGSIFEKLKRCIDRAQSAFVLGRLISDNVLIAYEILHTLRQKCTGKKGLMAVKLDMSKAYDRVEWIFLKEVMIKMGFAKEWVTLIMRCISTMSYIVNINGSRGRIFKPMRGLGQGGPLSPFLFLMYSEGLSSLIRLAIKNGSLKGIKASRRRPTISHLLFADDCILFGEATKEGARVLKEILRIYESCSGQCVNFNKSVTFYSSNTTEEVKDVIYNEMGVRNSINMEKYLGLPNVVGK
ncbi:hypothetical protein J1N35_014505 [Gossypium stocksii]|uniref:Reverse transcriptase domain-containing protein n=1 Tax=Gossypium stocksii TaxID=47602 RepID=A0A9D3VWJ0_9ROSI|nr:hypothetical protein J1N35_014505 [Gossypium stocksii]